MRDGALLQYLLGTLAVLLSTALAHLISPWAQLADLVIVYLLGAVAVAARFSLGPSLFCAVLSILVFDYFFIPPRLSLAWPDRQSALTFFGMLVVAGVVNGLSRNLRREREAARRSESLTLALQAFGNDLSGSSSLDQLCSLAARRLEGMFEASVKVSLCAGPRLDLAALDLSSDGERELARSAWTTRELRRGDEQGGYSLWLPLVGLHRALGVVGVARTGAPTPLDPDALRLLSLCVAQLAGAVERTMLASEARRAELQAETERTRGSIVAAISHDLKTPLASILMAASTLHGAEATLSSDSKRHLLLTVIDETERLARLVANLLALAKLEGATIALRRRAEDVPDLIQHAVRALGSRLREHRVQVEVPRNLPLVDVDSILVEQVLINLLENAAKHSPSNSTIRVSARASYERVFLCVSDEGVGISLEEREKVFEKFFRGSHATRGDGSVGLGLTICRAAVQAHGGRIYVKPGGDTGASIEFSLPANANLELEPEEEPVLAGE